MDRIDFKHIAREALDHCPALLMDLLPGGYIQGMEYVVKNPTRADRRAGSFSINYALGIWYDFSLGKGGGDLISLVAYIMGIPQAEAARVLARKLWGKNVCH